MVEFEGSVFDDVLELHHVVRCSLQGCEAVVDLLLAAGANLVMGALDLQSDGDALADHLVADIRVLVSGGDGEVAAFEGHLVTGVAAVLGAPRVPVGLGGVDGLLQELFFLL